ncbi:MAG: hypothetical protein LBC74_01010 [Planctomycetaceae bacterium]|jgi:hypothetical protein|nr:hypothetical protein [Planctomycetaceae bacterium]
MAKLSKKTKLSDGLGNYKVTLGTTLNAIEKVACLAREEGFLVMSNCRIFGKKDPHNPSKPADGNYGVWIVPYYAETDRHEKLYPM